jgi:hypothetical protein
VLLRTSLAHHRVDTLNPPATPSVNLLRYLFQSLASNILDSSLSSNQSTRFVDMMWGCSVPTIYGRPVSPPISPSYGLRYPSNHVPPIHPTYVQPHFRFNPEAYVFIPGAFMHPHLGELADDESIISVRFGRRGLNPATPPFVPASTAVHDQLMKLFHGDVDATDQVSRPGQEILVHDNSTQQYISQKYIGGHQHDQQSFNHLGLGYLDRPHNNIYDRHCQNRMYAPRPGDFDYPSNQFYAGSPGPSTHPVFAMDPRHAFHHSSYEAGK